MIMLSEKPALRYANAIWNAVPFILLILLSTNALQAQDLDIQGHRGCRGLMPENTIPAFIKAVSLGVTTLELDVVISKDGQVVVSHDLYLNPAICLSPDGKKIAQKHDYALYQMDYVQIAHCDCGSRQHPDFPKQATQKVPKPLLSQVIDTVEAYLKANNLPPIHYNIETKLSPEGDGTLHPKPADFVDLLMAVLEDKNILPQANIQSFDVRTLQYAHQQYPQIPLALLVEDQSATKNLQTLGFTPDIYSPYYKLVNPKLMAYARHQGMKVIPWTVNQPEDIQKMLSLRVDGIISDYPDRVINLVND